MLWRERGGIYKNDGYSLTDDYNSELEATGNWKANRVCHMSHDGQGHVIATFSSDSSEILKQLTCRQLGS